MTSKPTRGGARPGGGRRAIDGAKGVERVTITLDPSDRARLRQLGGSPWVRRKIREEIGQDPLYAGHENTEEQTKGDP